MSKLTIDRATLEQLVVALEGVEALIEHQYTGTREGMNALQNASDDAQVALTAGRAALANAEPTGWIAVKDRMPPPQVRVIGFEPQYNIVDVDMWFGPDFNWGYSYWMPLPAAPVDTP